MSSCRPLRKPGTTQPRLVEVRLNFSYRDDQLLVRDTVRDFVQSRIVPNAEAWNEKGEFPLEILPELAALGLTGLAVPHEYGGAELDVLTIALVMEELGAGDGSIALTDEPLLYLATQDYPFKLPFNHPLVQIRRLLAHFDTSLAELYRAFLVGNAPADQPASIVREALALSPEKYDLLTQPMTATAALQQAYGLAADGDPE